MMGAAVLAARCAPTFFAILDFPGSGFHGYNRTTPRQHPCSKWGHDPGSEPMPGAEPGFAFPIRAPDHASPAVRHCVQ
jgi:hypothetical protein